LLQQAKLNDLDPQAWLADVLVRIASTPQSRLTELLPWGCRPATFSPLPDATPLCDHPAALTGRLLTVRSSDSRRVESTWLLFEPLLPGTARSPTGWAASKSAPATTVGPSRRYPKTVRRMSRAMSSNPSAYLPCAKIWSTPPSRTIAMQADRTALSMCAPLRSSKFCELIIAGYALTSTS
jgi:hypothetical protein